MSRIAHATIVVALLAAAAATAVAQGPLQEKVHYTISVPHAIAVGGYLLPPGRYVLYQTNTTDLNLFALYRNDLTGSPIALIRTTRVQPRSGGDFPKDAKIRLDFDEDSADARPVLRGWTVPGDDGYEVIAVDAEDDDLERLP
jgi:hypothetical protein